MVPETDEKISHTFVFYVLMSDMVAKGYPVS